MDQRSIAINMLGLATVLFLCISLYCFFKYAALRLKRWNNRITEHHYEIQRARQRWICNRMGVAVFAVVVICFGAVELNLFINGV